MDGDETSFSLVPFDNNEKTPHWRQRRRRRNLLSLVFSLAFAISLHWRVLGCVALHRVCFVVADIECRASGSSLLLRLLFVSCLYMLLRLCERWFVTVPPTHPPLPQYRRRRRWR